MELINQLSPWDKMLKKIVWKQLGIITNKKILDFGSGECITALFYSADNDVLAIEPSDEIYKYNNSSDKLTRIKGDINSLAAYPDEYFDVIICHNVLEYIDNKEEIVKELSRLLRYDGILSIVKHNRAGRVMQMAVLLDDFIATTNLLDGKNGTTKKYGEIKYYNDNDITKWDRTLQIQQVYGIRTFWDLQQNQENHKCDEWQDKMIELEMRVSTIEEYRNISFFHHLIIRKRGNSC